MQFQENRTTGRSKNLEFCTKSSHFFANIILVTITRRTKQRTVIEAEYPENSFWTEHLEENFHKGSVIAFDQQSLS
jgi:hypothetical protein